MAGSGIEAERVRAVLKKVGENINKINLLLSQPDIRKNIGNFGWGGEVVEYLRNDFNRILSMYGGSCSASAAVAPSPLFIHPISPNREERAIAASGQMEENVIEPETESERITRIRAKYPTQASYWADPDRPLILNAESIWDAHSTYPSGNIRGFFAPKEASGGEGGGGSIGLPLPGSYGGKRYRRIIKKRMTRRNKKH